MSSQIGGRGLFLIVVLAITGLVGGCTAVAHKGADSLIRSTDGTRILLMPVDVELSEISAGGLSEARADWTSSAQTYLAQALETELQKRSVDMLRPAAWSADNPDEQLFLQIVKLHGAVGQAILHHQYSEAARLPTKEGKLTWSLGPQVVKLRERYNAEYGLFIFIRDSYAGPGRVVLIVAAAALGVVVPGGAQLGFASLVDLRTGQVVWFNRIRRGHGDLRTAVAASETSQVLLTDMPK